MVKCERRFWGAAVLAAGLLGVHTVRSEPAGVKTFKEGDVLTAADLNASFVAVQAAPLAWSAFAQAQQDLGRVEGKGSVGQGRVGTFSFTSPVAGQVLVSASYEIRVRNSFDASDPAQCRLDTLLADAETGFAGCAAWDSCNLPGYAQSSINANLPTQQTSGSYLGVAQTATRMLPLKQGTNTVYLLGRTDCPAGVWGAISWHALSVQQGGTAAASIP